MKDTTNKVDYNVWCAGGYNNDSIGFAGNESALIYPSNEYSCIGESSLKIIRKDPLYGTTCFTRLSNLTGTVNITATLTIYCPNNNVKINLFNGSILTEVTCPPSSTSNTISLTKTIDSNYVDLRIFLNNPEDYCYIDNIHISY